MLPIPRFCFRTARSFASAAPRRQTAQPAVSSQGAVILDGAAISKQMLRKVSIRTQELRDKFAVCPGLAMIVVGARQDSERFISRKQSVADSIGFNSTTIRLPSDVTEHRLLSTIQDLNDRDDVHGILVQMPLPPHINQSSVVNQVRISKDVDGFHPYNLGRLALGQLPVNKPWDLPPVSEASNLESDSIVVDHVNIAELKVPFKGLLRSWPLNIACTPLGVLELIHRTGIDLHGKQVCIIGRSPIVGLPLTLLLMHMGATVTNCFKDTVDLSSVTRQCVGFGEADSVILRVLVFRWYTDPWRQDRYVADVLITAAGSPHLIRGDWVRPGAVVIDVGINELPADSDDGFGALVGDVAFDEVKEVASFITPVPGGVGPLTVSVLMANTLRNAYTRLCLPSVEPSGEFILASTFSRSYPSPTPRFF